MIQPTHATSNDVLILGGGLAGLTLALHCRQQIPNARIAVLEKNVFPMPEAAFKVGESTVEVGANYFANVLNLKQHIAEEQLPKLGLRFFFGSDDNTTIERRLELGSKRFAPLPSYQLDRGRFENYLSASCGRAGIRVIDGARVKSVQLGIGRREHRVEVEREGESLEMAGRWLVDASGRAAILKRQLGLAKPSPHNPSAAWFRVKARIKVDDWSSDPTWRDNYDSEAERWYSTNHLMGEGYWVWLIPLASGSTSIGIVADERIHPLSSFNSRQKALDWLSQHEPQCAQQVLEHADDIQDFLAIKGYAHECRQVFSPRRWGITGEAGFFLDPFYSPGSDFIAFANTLLSDLIRRDLSGSSSYLWRSMIYDRIFKRFYYGTAAVYQDQYPLFGNQQVMPIKILWDYLIYWSLTGFVCLHGRECDQFMYPRHLLKLLRLGKLNHCMQELFRQWHARSPGTAVGGSIDISAIPLVRNSNQRLLDDLDNRAYGRRFAENVAQMETLFWEIVDHANLDVAIPIRRRRHQHAEPHALSEVFRVTTPPAEPIATSLARDARRAPLQSA